VLRKLVANQALYVNPESLPLVTNRHPDFNLADGYQHERGWLASRIVPGIIVWAASAAAGSTSGIVMLRARLLRLLPAGLPRTFFSSETV